jgi:hypothetical protein
MNIQTPVYAKIVSVFIVGSSYVILNLSLRECYQRFASYFNELDRTQLAFEHLSNVCREFRCSSS